MRVLTGVYTHTDGTDFIRSFADAGGNDYLPIFAFSCQLGGGGQSCCSQKIWLSMDIIARITKVILAYIFVDSLLLNERKKINKVTNEKPQQVFWGVVIIYGILRCYAVNKI